MPTTSLETGSRDRLLAAAAAEFAARGFAGANVDRIARAARVNKAMIYYHFKSKAALYREILQDMFEAVGVGVLALALGEPRRPGTTATRPG
ncbi:MAG TPA: TetR/AcrR family transcriptional regulator, partial [Vicinamibacterales bacterium]|nr:TetR/AcrR family transcriptional regulator [Vicinamibacterales bacterium]